MKLIKFNEDKQYNEFRFVKGCVYKMENNFALRWLKRGCVEKTEEEMKKEKLKISKDPRIVEDKKEIKKEEKKEDKKEKAAIKEDKSSEKEKAVKTKDSEK